MATHTAEDDIANAKRQRSLTRKALGNAIDGKRQEADKNARALKEIFDKAMENREDLNHEKLQAIQTASQRYKQSLDELGDLYQQDTWGDYKEEERVTREFSILERARGVLAKGAKQYPDDGVSHYSRRTKHTSVSRASSSSSATRQRALAEAAAARKQAEYDRMITEKETARRLQEAEEKRRQEELRAQHDREVALMKAEKAEAVANAKLQAIDEAIRAEEEALEPDLPEIQDSAEIADRVEEWILNQQAIPTTDGPHPPEEQQPPAAINAQPSRENQRPRFSMLPKETEVPQQQNTRGESIAVNTETPLAIGQRGRSARPLVTSTPKEEYSLLETFAATNQRLVAEISRQNLPKCHPDTFSGDVTLFHPWKRSFKAMIADAEVSASQEMNYLRNFTAGSAQGIVDNFRRRQHEDPAKVLKFLWDELERRFGNTAAITNILLERLTETAKFQDKDSTGLQTFADLCADADSQLQYLPGLGCLNYPNVLRPIIESLPISLRSKWEKEIVKYAAKHHDTYPGFHEFASMIENQARMKNHPNVIASGVQNTFVPRSRIDKPKRNVSSSRSDTNVRRVLKTDTSREREKYCLFHQCKGHTLSECKAFSEKTFEERSDWILKNKLCFRCLEASHIAKECKADIRCDKCESDRHPTLLHKERDLGEEVSPKCTSVCNGRKGGLSCGKVILVDVFHQNRPDEIQRIYALIDDQSNASMITSDLANQLQVDGPAERYLLSTCSANKTVMYGRRVSGLVVSANGKSSRLPTLIECDHIPQEKHEIPTPEIAMQFDHLRGIAKEIPPVDPQAKVQLLIGRDAPELLKVRASKNGPKGAPWAQKLDLGWTISGQVCLNRVGGPVHVTARFTNLSAATWNRPIDKGNPQLLEVSPCHNHFELKDFTSKNEKNISKDVFFTTREDNEAAMSCDDRRFCDIMEKGIHRNERGNWEMPLPFRSPNTTMPNNRSQAVHRLHNLLKTLKRKPQMMKDYVEFLGNIFNRGHAVPVPLDNPSPAQDNKCEQKREVWYLPHFGVYHPKKPGKIRVVFDSSAEYQGVSLNKELLTGPDLANSLLGVLIRFRHDCVGAMCDVEQMFHSFYVNPKHQSYLRFLWFKNNDPKQEIVEYQMTVHLFGNGPSPAVATFGMRRTADNGEESFGVEAKYFIHRNFYVDDGLVSRSTANEVIKLIKDAQGMLATANIRLHKVISNSIEVVEAFPADDRASDVRDLDLSRDALPAQRSLGVYWNLEEDAFTFKVMIPDKPFTRRGVLSVINSIYDPMGLAVPVTLGDKLLLQQLVAMGKERNGNSLGWDDPLPDELARRWQHWKGSLSGLEKVTVARCYHDKAFGQVARAEIHAFSDASKDAIGAAVYLRLLNQKKEVNVALLYGQSRVAPAKTTSIPRLELCGAVLATQVVRKILKEIDANIDEVVFYTDSKVVLGYIQNESRRFYVYVANRVQMIRNVSEPHQWRYVDTESNPADLATRGTDANKLLDTQWLKGPQSLQQADTTLEPDGEEIPLDEEDPEVRKEITINRTSVTAGMGTERLNRFSNWSCLRRGMAFLIARARELKGMRKPYSQDQETTVEELNQASSSLVKMVQREVFSDEIEILEGKVSDHLTFDRQQMRRRKDALKGSRLYQLDPFVDGDGVLRVGGRLRRSALDFAEKHPAILPKQHHLSKLLVRHYHESIHHQGRQITHGAIRQAGYWITSGHSAITKVLSDCVVCKKGRRPMMTQRMADLPKDRTEPSPPFTSVGVDVFGPWLVRTRKLRGGASHNKRWGLLFTCLSSRAVHIELLESMDASSFICALRRFFALRGPAARIRCDRGTNFIGGKSEMDQALAEADQVRVQRYATEQGCEWIFNPPHSSHFGGVWERQIRTIRSVLNAMLTQIGSSQLTHELLSTLMAEVTGIVNSRPLAAIPSDAHEAQPLTPSMLLTMKSRPLPPIHGDYVPEDLYARRQWRRVQYLADQFWIRWRREYLHNLQRRSKWQDQTENLKTGDVVLVKDVTTHRNNWPLGRVQEAIESEDGNVRKAKILMYDGGHTKTLLRPINQLVLLLSPDKGNA